MRGLKPTHDIGLLTLAAAGRQPPWAAVSRPP